jgi:hypothetical protein
VVIFRGNVWKICLKSCYLPNDLEVILEKRQKNTKKKNKTCMKKTTQPNLGGVCRRVGKPSDHPEKGNKNKEVGMGNMKRSN